MSSINNLNPTTRFSDRVEDYVKYRPSYPDAVTNFFKNNLGLKPYHVIADIGSGTGLFSKLLLENGNRVYGIEPNAKMRKASEAFLSHYSNFKSVDATAEATGLQDLSIDFITVAQAFHWFDVAKTKKEFKRILKPKGVVTLLWNERKTKSSSFLKAYEEILLKYGQDYKETSRMTMDQKKRLDDFFAPKKYEKFECKNEQVFNWESLQGRLRSTSYSPPPNHPQYQPMMAALKQTFDQYQIAGIVKFEYITEVYYGTL